MNVILKIINLVPLYVVIPNLNKILEFEKLFLQYRIQIQESVSAYS